jgi:hypothetical protein
MRNFQKISHGLDTTPIVNAVLRQPELWNTERLRTTHPGTPHADVEDILLRFNDLTPYKIAVAEGKEVSEYAGTVIDEHESICFPAWHALPQVHEIIFDLMRYTRAIRLGRVIITRLAPGKVITPHVDGGSHAAYYRRYQLMLNNNPGSLFHCGGETVTMKTGELWWFNNGLEHSVENYSAEDRIAMIIDLGMLK